MTINSTMQFSSPTIPRGRSDDLLMRAPDFVMRLERMGASFPTRLSFMRQLLRLMQREAWTITASQFDLDENGYGTAVYQARTPERVYSLIAFSHQLPAEMRTDRVIAQAWDTTFALFDGEPSRADIIRLAAQVPQQEAGRYSPKELVLSRANRSVRLFDHVIEQLASGHQPDLQMLASVGYLARTTAVYGNGKFGIADRERVLDHPHMQAPFRLEMLTVYLIRVFISDLVEHIARCRNPHAFIPLDKALKRMLGIGNSTGLGMAPFLVTHPALVHNWVAAREGALARVRALKTASPAAISSFASLLNRAIEHVRQWDVADDIQMRRIACLREELDCFRDWLTTHSHDALTDDSDGASDGATVSFWNAAYLHAEHNFSPEACELIASLLIEPHGGLIDDLGDAMHAARIDTLEPGMTIGDLKQLLAENYAWALEIDASAAEALEFFWYISEEKLEPRLGRRATEDGMARETPLIIFRDIQKLHSCLVETANSETVAIFVFRNPEHRHTVRRVQAIANHPYGEIRDNLAGRAMRPIDLLRFKLAFFGASKFDPKSDRWTRITMYQGAPLHGELANADADDWCFPVWPEHQGQLSNSIGDMEAAP